MDPRWPHVPYQTDYLWASPALAKRLRSNQALASDEWFAISDHAPIVGEFDPASTSRCRLDRERAVSCLGGSARSGRARSAAAVSPKREREAVPAIGDLHARAIRARETRIVGGAGMGGAPAG